MQHFNIFARKKKKESQNMEEDIPTQTEEVTELVPDAERPGGLKTKSGCRVAGSHGDEKNFRNIT